MREIRLQSGGKLCILKREKVLQKFRGYKIYEADKASRKSKRRIIRIPFILDGKLSRMEGIFCFEKVYEMCGKYDCSLVGNCVY